jgi:hypothetical protein
MGRLIFPPRLRSDKIETTLKKEEDTRTVSTTGSFVEPHASVKSKADSASGRHSEYSGGCVSGCTFLTDESADTLSLSNMFRTIKHEIMSYFTCGGGDQVEERNQINYVTTSPTKDASVVSSISSKDDSTFEGKKDTSSTPAVSGERKAPLQQEKAATESHDATPDSIFISDTLSLTAKDEAKEATQGKIDNSDALSSSMSGNVSATDSSGEEASREPCDLLAIPQEGSTSPELSTKKKTLSPPDLITQPLIESEEKSPEAIEMIPEELHGDDDKTKHDSEFVPPQEEHACWNSVPSQILKAATKASNAIKLPGDNDQLSVANGSHHSSSSHGDISGLQSWSQTSGGHQENTEEESTGADMNKEEENEESKPSESSSPCGVCDEELAGLFDASNVSKLIAGDDSPALDSSTVTKDVKLPEVESVTPSLDDSQLITGDTSSKRTKKSKFWPFKGKTSHSTSSSDKEEKKIKEKKVQEVPVKQTCEPPSHLVHEYSSNCLHQDEMQSCDPSRSLQVLPTPQEMTSVLDDLVGVTDDVLSCIGESTELLEEQAKALSGESVCLPLNAALMGGEAIEAGGIPLTLPASGAQEPSSDQTLELMHSKQAAITTANAQISSQSRVDSSAATDSAKPKEADTLLRKSNMPNDENGSGAAVSKPLTLVASRSTPVETEETLDPDGNQAETLNDKRRSAEPTEAMMANSLTGTLTTVISALLPSDNNSIKSRFWPFKGKTSHSTSSSDKEEKKIKEKKVQEVPVKQTCEPPSHLVHEYSSNCLHQDEMQSCDPSRSLQVLPTPQEMTSVLDDLVGVTDDVLSCIGESTELLEEQAKALSGESVCLPLNAALMGGEAVETGGIPLTLPASGAHEPSSDQTLELMHSKQAAITTAKAQISSQSSVDSSAASDTARPKEAALLRKSNMPNDENGSGAAVSKPLTLVASRSTPVETEETLDPDGNQAEILNDKRRSAEPTEAMMANSLTGTLTTVISAMLPSDSNSINLRPKHAVQGLIQKSAPKEATDTSQSRSNEAPSSDNTAHQQSNAEVATEPSTSKILSCYESKDVISFENATLNAIQRSLNSLGHGLTTMLALDNVQYENKYLEDSAAVRESNPIDESKAIEDAAPAHDKEASARHMEHSRQGLVDSEAPSDSLAQVNTELSTTQPLTSSQEDKSMDVISYTSATMGAISDSFNALSRGISTILEPDDVENKNKGPVDVEEPNPKDKSNADENVVILNDNEEATRAENEPVMPAPSQSLDAKDATKPKKTFKKKLSKVVSKMASGFSQRTKTDSCGAGEAGARAPSTTPTLSSPQEEEEREPLVSEALMTGPTLLHCKPETRKQDTISPSSTAPGESPQKSKKFGSKLFGKLRAGRIESVLDKDVGAETFSCDEGFGPHAASLTFARSDSAGLQSSCSGGRGSGGSFLTNDSSDTLSFSHGLRMLKHGIVSYFTGNQEDKAAEVNYQMKCITTRATDDASGVSSIANDEDSPFSGRNKGGSFASAFSRKRTPTLQHDEPSMMSSGANQDSSPIAVSNNLPTLIQGSGIIAASSEKIGDCEEYSSCMNDIQEQTTFEPSIEIEEVKLHPLVISEDPEITAKMDYKPVKMTTKTEQYKDDGNRLISSSGGVVDAEARVPSSTLMSPQEEEREPPMTSEAVTGPTTSVTGKKMLLNDKLEKARREDAATRSESSPQKVPDDISSTSSSVPEKKTKKTEKFGSKVFGKLLTGGIHLPHRQ